MGIVVIVQIFLTLNFSFDFLLTAQWAEKPLLMRALYLIIVVNIKVLTMFIGFLSMESNFIATGQGYRPPVSKD
jgi:hypothetical protein